MTDNPYQSPESPTDPPPRYDSPLLSVFLIVLTIAALVVILWRVAMRSS